MREHRRPGVVLDFTDCLCDSEHRGQRRGGEAAVPSPESLLPVLDLLLIRFLTLTDRVFWASADSSVKWGKGVGSGSSLAPRFYG